MNPQDAWLDQLRDIHDAPAPPWWPPAWGWWVLAVLVLAVLAWLAVRAVRAVAERRRRNARLAVVERFVAGIDAAGEPERYVAGLNRMLKATAVNRFAAGDCAALSGAAWCEFLRAHAPRGARTDVLDVFATGPYRPLDDIDADALADFTRRWVASHG